MKTVSAVWRPHLGAKDWIAECTLNFSVDRVISIFIPNTIQDCSIKIEPKYLTVDNLKNSSSLIIEINNSKVPVVAFERATFLIDRGTQSINVSSNAGIVTCYFTDEPYLRDMKADNLQGNTFPVNDFYSLTSGVGTCVSDNVKLNAGDIAYFIVDTQMNIASVVQGRYIRLTPGVDISKINSSIFVNQQDPILSDMIFGLNFMNNLNFVTGDGVFGANLSTTGGAGGIFRALNSLIYAAVASQRAVNEVWIRAKEDCDVSIQCSALAGTHRIHAFRITNSSEKTIDGAANCARDYSLYRRGDPLIATAPAATYILPNMNLTGRKRLSFMIVGAKSITSASVQTISSKVMTEIYDSGGLSISRVLLDDAGSTGAPSFVHAALAGIELEYALTYFEAD